MWSVPVGAALCLLYDIIRIIRRRLKTGLPFAIVSDILFFAFCAFVAFCIFLVFCSGQIRFYVFLGLLAGFLICRFTVSKIFIGFIDLLLSFIIKVLRLLSKGLAFILHPIGRFLSKTSDFTLNILKKLLQPMQRLLYNLKVKKSNVPQDSESV